mmetsp:Transcript_10307/g.44765  ORF Transcript_10307/g.44765 Transcript_10307/m.44765 type:complete len:328 (-) Transcript_10307:761-1744(-)
MAPRSAGGDGDASSADSDCFRAERPAPRLLPRARLSSEASILRLAPASMTCAAPITPAALSAASIPRVISAWTSLSCASAPATSSASGTTVVSSPTVIAPRSTNDPPYHSHAATAVDGTAANSARCRAWTLVAWRRALDASASASSYLSSSASSCANVRIVRAPANRSAAMDAALSFAAAALPCALEDNAPIAPNSATPGGTIPSATAEISREIRHRLATPCAAVAAALTPPVSDRATTSATCAISDPSRSLRSPAHRASIATVSSVSRHAKMRRRRFASIDVLASPVTFASKNLAHASATRMHASSRRGLVGTPLGTPVRFLPMRS